MTKANFIMKNLLNLGKVLNKAEQKEVFGGRRPVGISDGQCINGGSCNPYGDSSECEFDSYCQGGVCTCTTN